jgi:basic amino acid/polyamine antiporter, APA family
MTELKRALGLSGLSFYGLGIIIGAGIYSVIGAAAGTAQEGLWLSFVLGGIVAFLTGLSYAELATTFPEAGAEYVYLRHALPRYPLSSFMIGFILSIAAASTAAAVSLAFAGYLQIFVQFPVWVLAMALLIAATILNIAGIQQASYVNILFTVVEIVGLIIVIGLGLQTSEFGNALQAPLHFGILAATAIIFFVYLGFEDIANLAEEAKDPNRDIPRSIFISLGITTTLYVLVGLAVVALLTPDELAASNSPLATAVESQAPGLVNWMGAIALFATANTVLTTLIVGSRMLLSMARRGDVPKFIERVLPKQQTPWVAAVMMLVLSSLFLPLGTVEAVASLSSFASLLAFTSVNLALIGLRYLEPELERPFRIPFEINGFPILPALGAVATLILATQFDAQVYFISVLIIGLGLALYFTKRYWNRGQENQDKEP